MLQEQGTFQSFFLTDKGKIARVQVFSGGSCNALDADGNLVETIDRMLVNRWLQQNRVDFTDPQLPVDESWSWEVHGEAEVLARETATVRYYFVSSRTFGPLTHFEISLDLEQLLTGGLSDKHIVVLFDELRDMGGNPLFRPDGLNIVDYHSNSTTLLLAHFKEAVKAGNKMRQYIWKLAQKHERLFATTSVVEAQDLINRFGGKEKVEVFEVDPHMLSAAKLTEALVKTFTGHKPVVVYFRDLGSDTTPTFKPFPLPEMMDLDWAKEYRRALITLMPSYIEEGDQMRARLWEALQRKSGIKNLHVCDNVQAVMEAIAEALRLETKQTQKTTQKLKHKIVFVDGPDGRKAHLEVNPDTLTWVYATKHTPIIGIPALGAIELGLVDLSLNTSMNWKYPLAKTWYCVSDIDKKGWFQGEDQLIGKSGNYTQGEKLTNGWFRFYPRPDRKVQIATFKGNTDHKYAVTREGWGTTPQKDGRFAIALWDFCVLIRRDDNPADIWVTDLQYAVNSYRILAPASHGAPDVLATETVYDFLGKGIFQIVEVDFTVTRLDGDGVMQQKRVIFRTGNSAMALVYDEETNEVILTYQHRMAVQDGLTQGWIYEAMAASIEKGEQPEDAIRRELLEELGYKASSVVFVGNFVLSPGRATEHMAIYLVFATRKDQVKSVDIGGVLTEGEMIQRVRIPLATALAWVKDGTIYDLKTAYALHMLHEQVKVR